ncbi:MAG: M14 family zinc carboxypeptidase [Phycisphaerae bacterium]|nr:M14 family zinc carboxypeptidase [Phycisphaerae bacterium]
MGIRILTDFPGAAAEKIRVVDAEKRVCFAAPLHDSPRGMWFHFKVIGGDGGPVTFVLTNRDQMLGAGDYRRAVPVFRPEGGQWRRVDPLLCSVDEPGRSQTFIDPHKHRQAFMFAVPCGAGETEVAYCYPYTFDMVTAALARWGKQRGTRVLTVCKSAAGRPVRVLQIGTPARGKKCVWVTARQHSGEVPGSFAAEGLVDAILSSAAWAKSLRQRAAIFVCPAVDVDGVAEGMYGKDRAPVDFNRDWRLFPQRAEIRALRKLMDATREKCAGKGTPMLVNLDLHGPGPGAVSFPVPPHPAWSGRESWQRAWWFAKLVERNCPESSPVRWANSWPDHIDWSPPANSCRCSSTFHAACSLADYSQTIELTYNWQGNNQLATPDDWRRIGQAAAKAIESLARGAKLPPGVRPPDPPYYLSPFWAWLNVPRECNAKVNEELVSIQADGPQGYAALLFSEPIPLGRGRFSAAAEVYRTSHGKCPATRLIFFFKNGIFTGEVCEQVGELSGQAELHWRGPATRKHPADSARLGVTIRNWPGTLTIAKPKVADAE